MFNLNWFFQNESVVKRMLNFWSEIFWMMQPENCRIKIYQENDHKLVKYWFVSHDGQKFVKGRREFKVFPTGAIDIDEKIALRDPLVWVIAYKLQYLVFPRKWERVSKWIHEQGRDACVVANGERIGIKVRDKYGHVLVLPIELIKKIATTYDTLRVYRQNNLDLVKNS